MKVKILWAEYDFVYEPRLVDDDGSVLFGTSEFANRRLRVDSLLPDEHQRITVFHELLHAISYLSGLDLTENQTRGLSHQFYAVLKDNPGLAAHIVPGGKR